MNRLPLLYAKYFLNVKARRVAFHSAETLFSELDRRSIFSTKAIYRLRVSGISRSVSASHCESKTIETR